MCILHAVASLPTFPQPVGLGKGWSTGEAPTPETLVLAEPLCAAVIQILTSGVLKSYANSSGFLTG